MLCCTVAKLVRSSTRHIWLVKRGQFIKECAEVPANGHLRPCLPSRANKVVYALNVFVFFINRGFYLRNLLRASKKKTQIFLASETFLLKVHKWICNRKYSLSFIKYHQLQQIFSFLCGYCVKMLLNAR